MGYPSANSFRQAVLAAVLGGADTVAEVLALVSHRVSASAATRRDKSEWLRAIKKRYPNARTPPLEKLVARGRRVAVTNTLYDLARAGLIRQSPRGVYGPPEPKLFQPQAS